MYSPVSTSSDPKAMLAEEQRLVAFLKSTMPEGAGYGRQESYGESIAVVFLVTEAANTFCKKVQDGIDAQNYQEMTIANQMSKATNLSDLLSWLNSYLGPQGATKTLSGDALAMLESMKESMTTAYNNYDTSTVEALIKKVNSGQTLSGSDLTFYQIFLGSCNDCLTEVKNSYGAAQANAKNQLSTSSAISRSELSEGSTLTSAMATLCEIDNKPLIG